MTPVMTFSVATQLTLQSKIDQKTKPLGALGQLEDLALQIGLIQQTLTPVLRQPTMLVFAADHGIAHAGVSAYPQAVTEQMVLNFLRGGAAINVFCRANGLDLRVVDAGVNADFNGVAGLIDRKVAHGTANMAEQPAMTAAQCTLALAHGQALAQGLADEGCNVLGLGEMGIANTSSAALLAHCYTGLPLADCVGRGTGLDDAGLARKLSVLSAVLDLHGKPDDAMGILRCYGGLEIAMMAGAMLGAAARGMVVLVDGFIASAAYLAAAAIQPAMRDYAVFSHCSGEHGHRHLLAHLQARPLLSLGLRLGEGTGAALAYPLLVAAVAFLNEMATFASAGVSEQC
ncbi:MAG: nicotinate-nucleotide--dimethylbenzimidazole phosphoribosyltransferase [Sulfuriferula sp.]|nr:nicotinate-nucleotide--dimethylbenzimidazole phosphoribosyltransferase [Sulfuriferula sp.]